MWESGVMRAISRPISSSRWVTSPATVARLTRRLFVGSTLGTLGGLLCPLCPQGVNDCVLKDSGKKKALKIKNGGGWKDTVVWSPYGNEGMGYKVRNTSLECQPFLVWEREQRGLLVHRMGLD